ncbi:MAG: alpha/beta fold hydrolase [Candidatus Omnitrophota bacterium]
MWARILIDIFLIILGTVLVTGFRSLKPKRMPIVIRPADLGLESRDVVFQTRDGKTLKGWFIPSKKARGTIIGCHGYPANKSDILPVISFLNPEFNLLLFDFRAHGESEGFITTFGLKEVWDLEAAIDYLKEDPDAKSKPVGVWGYSLGGAVAILTAAGNPHIKAVVSDSAFANFPEMVTVNFQNLGPLKYAFSFLSRLLSRVIFRMDYIRNSPEFHIGKVHVPVLLIHSPNDEFVPIDHARRLYRNANPPKELLETGGTHTSFEHARVDDYQTKTRNWFEKYLQ